MPYFHPPTTNPLILPSLKCPVEFYCLIKTKTLHGFIISFLSAFPCLLSTVLIATIITLKYNWKKKEKGQNEKTVGQLLVLLGCQYLEGNKKGLKCRFKLNLFWREKITGFEVGSLGLGWSLKRTMYFTLWFKYKEFEESSYNGMNFVVLVWKEFHSKCIDHIGFAL